MHFSGPCFKWGLYPKVHSRGGQAHVGCNETVCRELGLFCIVTEGCKLPGQIILSFDLRPLFPYLHAMREGTDIYLYVR